MYIYKPYIKILKEKKADLNDVKMIYNIEKLINSDVKKDSNSIPVCTIDSIELIESIIKSKRGDIYLYYHNNTLVGFFAFNCPDDCSLIKEKYLIDKYLSVNYESVGIAETFLVMPEYRGNKLQYQMIKRLEKIAKKRGIDNIIATVHPDNIYSCNNFDKAKYITLATINIYENIRYLKYKSI